MTSALTTVFTILLEVLANQIEGIQIEKKGQLSLFADGMFVCVDSPVGICKKLLGLRRQLARL